MDMAGVVDRAVERSAGVADGKLVGEASFVRRASGRRVGAEACLRDPVQTWISGLSPFEGKFLRQAAQSKLYPDLVPSISSTISTPLT